MYTLLAGVGFPLPGDQSVPIHPIGIQIFDTLNSLNSRLDLLRELLNTTASKEQTIYFQNELRKDISGRFNERSIIAHGNWTTLEQYPDALILINHTKGHRIYKEHDFTQVSKRIADLHEEIGAFLSELYATVLLRTQPDQK